MNYRGSEADSVMNRQQYAYDLNGNLLYAHANGGNGHTRSMVWDEENRVMGISSNGYISNYLYDAEGERTVKMHGNIEGMMVNGRTSALRMSAADFTAYVSPYLVVSPGGNYTKHIYAGPQRIASRLSNGTLRATSLTKAGRSGVNYSSKRTRIESSLTAEYDSLGATFVAPPNSFDGSGTNTGDLLYFYHPDHLGSSSMLTTADGVVS